VERCDFGAAEIAGLRAERKALRKFITRLVELAQTHEHIGLHQALELAEAPATVSEAPQTKEEG